MNQIILDTIDENKNGYRVREREISDVTKENIIGDAEPCKKYLIFTQLDVQQQQFIFLQKAKASSKKKQQLNQMKVQLNSDVEDKAIIPEQKTGENQNISPGQSEEESEATIIKAEYEKDELQNQQLNEQLNQFSYEIIKSEEIHERQASKPIISHKPGDKLAEKTISQILDLVKENKHWTFCLNHYFEMQKNSFEEKRLSSDPVLGHYQFKNDWERDSKTGRFIFLNKEKIAQQKKVISFILSKIGSAIISGKSITSISLPIDIFETRSNLERFAYSCSFAPLYLKRASESNDPLEQIKNTAVYLITTTIMYLNLEKPFNPILGETYQGRLDGCPIYCEQISHHPPICAYQYYTDSYVLNGQIESVAHMHANSVTGINQGNVAVTFLKTGNSIGLIQAPGSLNGTTFGTRYMSVDGKYIAYDIKNKLVFEVKVNPEKKGLFKSATMPIDYFVGGIYRVNDKFITKFNSLKPKFYKFQGLNMKEDVVEQLSTVNGSWDQDIFIDDKKWFDIQGPPPFLLENEVNSIPSDCNYREDILYLKDNKKKEGQEFKDLLELSQRADRKLRDKNQEKLLKLLKKKQKVI